MRIDAATEKALLNEWENLTDDLNVWESMGDDAFHGNLEADFIEGVLAGFENALACFGYEVRRDDEGCPRLREVAVF